MITELNVEVGQPFYSRYEIEGEEANAIISGEGNSGDTATVKLIRRTLGGERTLATQVVTLTGTPLRAEVIFDLTAIKDDDGFSTVKASKRIGDYRITAEAGNVKNKAAFTVTPISPKKMREDFLWGIPLTSANVLAPGGAEPLKMSDESIVENVLNHTDELATTLGVYLEPTLIVTNKTREGFVYDIEGEGMSYYPSSAARWLTVTLPYPKMQKVHLLSAWLNQDKALTLGKDWRIEHTLSGSITLAPSSGAIVDWQTLGLGMTMFARAQNHIPGFWHYAITAGLLEIPPELIHYIGKMSALETLGVVGNARYPDGVTSVSISRDGVSENRSFNPKGPYAALIDQYSKDLGIGQDGKNTVLPRLKQKYRGLLYTSM